jgi:predicted acyl esterase
VEFKTPPIVENTEICGPIVLNLFGSTTAREILWFASLWHFDAEGRSTLLTRGWLRGSQRKLDPAASRPWQPVHLHTQREPLEPNQIYEFNIEIRPYGILLKPGDRIGIKIKSADNDVPQNYLELVGIGHVSSASYSQVTVHHSSDHPSHLLLPITRGNRIGTFISGGKLPPVQRP